MNRRSLSAILAVLSITATLMAADVAGTWRGTLQPGMMKLRLGLNVKRGASGALTATMDSYDQGALGLPVDSITQNGDKVAFTMAAIGASFEGTLSADGNGIDGKFTQGGMTFPLRLTRGAGGVEAARRPQEPKPPYPYREEDVTADNTKGGVKLSGTLTFPNGAGPFPAVILVSGSGTHDRNETIFGHKPFLVIADFLTRQGIAVLRFDDRGAGKSTGNKMQSTEEDLAGDALAWVAFLKLRKDIAPAHIGLVGHSEGGIIGPLAAVRSADVAFVVLLAGPAIPGDQLLKTQARALMHASGAPEAAIRAENEGQDRLFSVIRAGGDPKDVEQHLRTALGEYLAQMPEAQRKGIGNTQAFENAQVKAIMAPGMRSIILSDPGKTLREVKCPVLALNGALDLQVPADVNLPALVAELSAGGNPDYEVVKLPGLNHLFQSAKRGLPGEYGTIEETFSPPALTILSQWIARHTK
jgi:pimeloyl-ACP methyl ester carboxylesterase